MVADTLSRDDLIRKYKLAGKIRFICFCMLLSFLLIMKEIGGYSYINIALVSLIVVEAILNQPYGFIVRRVNVARFQYYQMLIDIISISWILYYMGGIEAPLVSMAYYAVILWAGVVSTTAAVFFAVIVSSISYASVVVLARFGLLPAITFFEYQMPLAQLFSLMLGNVAFLFAFGYFSAHSSNIIKFLERKRHEESLKYLHKLMTIGYLIGNTTHDILNNLANIEGYAQILLDKLANKGEKVDADEKEMLQSIEQLDRRSIDLLSGFSEFSKRREQQFSSFDIHHVIEDALKLTGPVIRYGKMAIEKVFAPDLPLMVADKEQLGEVFVVMILNAFDAIEGKGVLVIKTNYNKKTNAVEIFITDTGHGIKQEFLNRVGKPSFSTKEPPEGRGMSLAIAYEIVARHKGKVKVESAVNKGTTFTIELPVAQSKKGAAQRASV